MAETKHFNVEAEKELLARIMLDNKIITTLYDDLKPEDFIDQKHQAIYSVMLSLMKSGKVISPVSLSDYLKEPGILVSSLLEIQGMAAATSDYETYAGIIKEHSNKRKLLSLLRHTAKDLEEQEYKDVITNLSTNLYKASESHYKEDVQTDEEVMGKALDFIEKAIESNGESVGMKTNLRSLDKALKGFHKGDLMLIAARPSMGKTMFMLTLAEKLSLQNNVCLFELEMSSEKLSLRRLAAMANIPLNKLYAPQDLREIEMQILMRNINLLESRNRIFTDTTTNISLPHLRNKIQYLKATKGLDVVFIDHIGLMKQNSKLSSRNEGIGEITQGLKAIAKDFNICVIALSQLSRAVESRVDKRPMLSDLRDSGSLEQDADQVIFLYRDLYYNGDRDSSPPDNEPIEVIIAKNRDGAAGSFTLKARLAYQSISDY